MLTFSGSQWYFSHRNVSSPVLIICLCIVYNFLLDQCTAYTLVWHLSVVCVCIHTTLGGLHEE